MRARSLILLLVVAGCQTLVPGEKMTPAVTRVPAVPVTAEEVNSKNAHEKSIAVLDELDDEELRRSDSKKEPTKR